MPLDVYYISILSYKNMGYKFPLLRGAVVGFFLAVRSLSQNLQCEFPYLCDFKTARLIPVEPAELPRRVSKSYGHDKFMRTVCRSLD